MLDGNIIGDSMPYSAAEEEKETAARLAAEQESERVTEEKADELEASETGETPLENNVKPQPKKRKEKKPTMSFWTAFKLSLRNLFTKKGRTTLTSFAGSIGIIGIALILAVSQGTTAYINHVQETTLSSYPLTLEAQTVDMMSLMESFMSVGANRKENEKDGVYKDPIIGELVNALANTQTNENDLKAFKKHLEAEIAKEESSLKNAVNGVQYSYDLELSVYTQNIDGVIIKSDTAQLMTEMIGKYFMATGGASGGTTSGGTAGGATGGGTENSATSSPFAMMMNVNMWQELLPGLDQEPVNDLLKRQYDVIYGGWPNEYDEIVLVVNENNELNDLTLFALGLLSQTEIDAIIDSAAKGEEMPVDTRKWTYEEICGRTYKTVLPADNYMKDENSGLYVDISKYESSLPILYQKATELKVVGIIRPNEDSEAHMLSGDIGYTRALTEYVIEKSCEAEISKAQVATPTVDVLTGLPFQSTTGDMTDAEKAAAFKARVAAMPQSGKAALYHKVCCVDAEANSLKTMTDAALSQYDDKKEELVNMLAQGFAAVLGGGVDEIAAELSKMEIAELKELARPGVEEQVKLQLASMVEGQLAGLTEAEKAAALDGALATATDERAALYYDELTVFSPNTYEENLVKFGCLDLESPMAINIYAKSFEDKDVIVAAIDRYNKSVDEAQKIDYTDYMGLLMSSVTTIIDAITYVLIAFVSISLIVSSIMIGVITLISVQERTKEIGILRAIGASKRDVSSMFNAETLIIGFTSGLLGVLVTYLLCIPINLILQALTGIPNLQAVLPLGAAVILVLISMGLTLLSGLIPSRSAAKKDPVIALRSE
ncbi:MAG: ABC transporter permease [Clostridia bacterium]|nr:ABC transporter permease [Clostridia bacterium]